MIFICRDAGNVLRPAMNTNTVGTRNRRIESVVPRVNPAKRPFVHLTRRPCSTIVIKGRGAPSPSFDRELMKYHVCEIDSNEID